MTVIRTPIPNAKSNVDYEQTVGYRRFIIGQDVGKRNDPSSFTIIKDEQVPLPRWGKGFKQLQGDRTMSVVQAFRLPLKMPYAEQANFVLQLLGDAALEESAHLYVDATGVGAAYCELLDNLHIRYRPVHITSGDSWSEFEHEKYRVSKMWLLNAFSVAMQSGALKISENIDDITQLKKELEDFQVGLTATGQITANSTAMSHDDLILATAIAYFGASTYKGAGMTVSPIKWR